MDHVRVLEGARHHADGVRLADVGEELVAQPLALAGAAHDPGDVHEGDRRRYHPRGVEQLGELVQARIRQGHNPHVRLNGRERVVGGQDGRAGQSIEQGGLADVGQSDDSDGKCHAAEFRRPL